MTKTITQLTDEAIKSREFYLLGCGVKQSLGSPTCSNKTLQYCDDCEWQQEVNIKEIETLISAFQSESDWLTSILTYNNHPLEKKYVISILQDLRNRIKKLSTCIQRLKEALK